MSAAPEWAADGPSPICAFCATGQPQRCSGFVSIANVDGQHVRECRGGTAVVTLDLAKSETTMVTNTLDRVQIWHQVGWLGQATGRVFTLDDPARRDDPAGYMPLWVLVENDYAVPPDPDVTNT